MIEFEKSYKIPVYDTDFNGKLYLHSLLNYVQDIASEHAEKLGFGRDDLSSGNRFWILSRLYLVIYRMPDWRETIMLKTWPRGTEGLFALRDIEIRDSEGQMIAAAATSWVIVDIKTRRPCRPDYLLEGINKEFPGNRSLPRNAGKVSPAGDAAETAPTFRVKISDLDVNLHVNNVKYIQWVYDTMPLSFLSATQPASIEINYLAESVADDMVYVSSDSRAMGNNCINYSVIREGDGKELCRIMIEWKPASNEKV
jgi:acyl-ACP thioesterase